MPEYLIEVEDSTLTTYRVKAKNEQAAKSLIHDGMAEADIVEEHENTEFVSCVEILE